MDYLETPTYASTGGTESTKIKEPYDEPPRDEKPYDALPVSGAGRDRAGGLPPQRVSCHDGNAAPPRRMLAQLVGSRSHAMPSRVTGK